MPEPDSNSVYANPKLRMPHAKQMWRAPSPKTRGGYRYVRIERVYRPAMAIHTATSREVTKAGKDLRPDHEGPTGEIISTSFDIGCYPDGTMPLQYELVK